MFTFLVCGFFAIVPFGLWLKYNRKITKKISFETSIVIMFCFFFLAIGLISYGGMVFSKEKSDEMYKEGEVFLYKKENGCSKFSFYEDTYYRCPKELNINYIVENYSYSCGKTTCTKEVDIPVKPF